jgi:PAS domain S-box-containing protein
MEQQSHVTDLRSSWASPGELYRFQIRETTKHAVFAMDTEGILLSWNRGVEELLGYPENEWVGQHASIIFTPAEVARAVCQAEMEFAARHDCSSDIRWHARKDGTELFAHGYMTALRLDDGTLVGYSKILSDETRSKLLQDSLTESNRALEQFAHIASHDLQEPLRTMGTSAELLARRLNEQLDESSRALVDRISSGARRMTKLIEDLLAYARNETQDGHARSVSLAQDLETAISELEASIKETGAVITHDTLPSLDTAQGQMVRLFQNLIGNAIKYHKPDTPPVIHISAEKKENFWEMSVEDNGIGFDPRHAQEIFQPFKRLHSQQDYPGTGVGLAICRRIVEAHGGRIWAESEPGKGTCVYFRLPAGEPTHA